MTRHVAGRVLLTDAPWSDISLEQEIFDRAGLEFVHATLPQGAQESLEELVATVDPVAIVTCWAPITAELIRRTRGLKIISRLGAGVDNVDVGAASERNIWVTNVPDYCVGEVSDHAIALLLAHYRGIVRLDIAVKTNGWRSDAAGLERVSDLTVGIIGLGRIGRETARKLKAFGCRVLAVAGRSAIDAEGVEFVNLETLAALSDAIILHVPMNAATAGMIDAGFFSRCAKRPLVINMSRGGLVNNEALAGALNSGQIRGAALDVIDGEPSPPPSLINRTDVIVTPHVAYASRGAIVELRTRACEEVVRVLAGSLPRNPWNVIGNRLSI